MFDPNKKKLRNVVTFSKQMYNHDMRFLIILTAILLYFFVDSVKWSIQLEGGYLSFTIGLGVITAVLVGLCVLFLVKPFAHPVYRQYLKYFDDIPSGTVEIDLAFVHDKIGFMLGSAHISNQWSVEVSPFFSKLTRLEGKVEK